MGIDDSATADDVSILNVITGTVSELYTKSRNEAYACSKQPRLPSSLEGTILLKSIVVLG